MKEPRKILVTGASRGIGQAIAVELAQAGYSLLLHASVKENLYQTIEQLPAKAEYQALAADFSRPDAVGHFIQQLKKEHKDLYGIVSNAGIALDKPLSYQPEREIDLLLQVNLKVPILLGKLALKLFLKNREGVCINIASCIGQMGNAYQSVYAATKAGLVALSKSWAKEMGQLLPQHRVRFLSVAPGLIETDMTTNLDEQVLANYQSQIPANRFGQAQDVAQLIAFLISDRATYINGSTISINGGLL
ncbi:MAG: SDR family oxidoreductase [Bacteroidota bacterium]